MRLYNSIVTHEIVVRGKRDYISEYIYCKDLLLSDRWQLLSIII